MAHMACVAVIILLTLGLPAFSIEAPATPPGSSPSSSGPEPLRVQPPTKPLLFNDLHSSSILIIVAGTTRKPLQTDTQQRTFGQHFHMVLVTEAHAHECVFCGNMDGTESHKGADQFFSGEMETRFDQRPIGWYCARKLQYLQAVLQHITWQPEYIVMIDDDTFVSPLELLKFLSRQHRSAPIIYGNAWEGGAGFIFTKGALQKLASDAPVTHMVWDRTSSTWVKSGSLSLLGLCLHRGLGGAWCYMHDDHFVGACAKAADTKLWKLPTMIMVCRVGTFENALRPPSVWLNNQAILDWVKSDWLTCHYTDHETMLSMYEIIADAQFSTFIVSE